MPTTQKSLYIFSLLALCPCIIWGLMTFGCVVVYDLSYPKFLATHIYRITYLLRALVFLPMLMGIYKNFLPVLYHGHQRIYISYSILSIICILCGLFVKTKFWNYMLDGCLVSPLIEELIGRFILYEAHNKGLKVYTLVAIITSLSFGIMHFGYDVSLLTKSLARPQVILPRLGEHLIFGLILCAVFWFLPSLSLLIIIHSLSNLYSMLSRASELSF